MFRKTHLSAYPDIRENSVKIRPAISGARSEPRTSFAISWSGIFLLLIVTMGVLVLPTSAYATPESIVAAGNVYVSSVTIDPAVLFTGDEGTATFYVTNGNSNKSIVVNHATFGDQDIRLTSGTYDASANIGPLQTRPFVFSIASDAFEGTYYPTFSLSFRDADSLYYRTPVQVDNTPLVLTIIDKPDIFTKDKKDLINVQIANPRNNDVKNVILEVSGDGVTALPSKIYIGALASGANTNTSVSITPGTESPLNITVNYDNGDSHHAVSLDIPVSFALDKKKASPLMSNVQVKLENGIYHVTGDITNAGLATANAVSVTSLSPATVEDPYKNYIVGVLKPDDFGSFEVTFKTDGATSVPVQISYKDADGNVITSRQDVALTVTDTAQQQNSSILLPVIVIVLIIALASGGYLYLRKRKNR
jgi:flagellar basal body-associated protein FliL